MESNPYQPPGSFAASSIPTDLALLRQQFLELNPAIAAAKRRQSLCYLMTIAFFIVTPIFFCGCPGGDWLERILSDGPAYFLLLLAGTSFGFAIRFRLRVVSLERRTKLLNRQIAELPKELL